jgi:hypothetical protein
MGRRTGLVSRIVPTPPARWRRAALLGCALMLAGCGAVEVADRSLRRIDILDRVFDPGRFREPPKPPLTPAPLVVQAEPLPPQQPATASYETGSDAPPRSPAWTDPPETVSRSAEPVAAEPEPRASTPDPGVRRAALLRQYPWLSRFWGELDTTQQGRVSRAMRRTGSPGPEDAERWDRMGLADRVRLVFGGA